MRCKLVPAQAASGAELRSTALHLWDACAFPTACKLPAVVAAHERAVLINAALTEWGQPAQCRQIISSLRRRIGLIDMR
jgi:hypothetical protein